MEILVPIFVAVIVFALRVSALLVGNLFLTTGKSVVSLVISLGQLTRYLAALLSLALSTQSFSKGRSIRYSAQNLGCKEKKWLHRDQSWPLKSQLKNPCFAQR
jgi:hypothetical protein